MPPPHDALASAPDRDLRGRTLRGGAITVVAQGIKILLRFGSMAVMARFVAPADFGLIAMVTAVTGFVALFKDGGLSMATVQRAELSQDQVSTLFWINLAVGASLTLLLIAAAPAIAHFYGEPRLVLVTMLLSIGLLLGGASVQHDALLRRQMRFGSLALIELSALLFSAAIGITLALAGFHYWSLVGMALAAPFASALGAWLTSRWCPGLPKRGVGVRSMLAFGGKVTARSVLIYLARNADNVLIGWAWGPVALGFYSRAYQLLMLPIEQINSPVSAVLVPALSRLQSDPERFRRYFLQSYVAVISAGVPLVGVAALFSDELIRLVFGAGWEESARLFRLLATAALAGALMNPMGWLLVPLGLVGRNLSIALIINPLIVLSFLIGLPSGAEGVAIAYSIAMVALVIPCFYLMTRETCVRVSDLLRAVSLPLSSLLIAGVIAWGVKLALTDNASLPIRALVGPLTLFLVYSLVLLYVFRQKELFFQFFRQFRRASAPTPAIDPSSGSAQP